MSRNEFICDCNIIHQDSVDIAKAKMPEIDTFYKLADFFNLLGDTSPPREINYQDEYIKLRRILQKLNQERLRHGRK